jgi:hypothetical protein
LSEFFGFAQRFWSSNIGFAFFVGFLGLGWVVVVWMVEWNIGGLLWSFG